MGSASGGVDIAGQLSMCDHIRARFARTPTWTSYVAGLPYCRAVVCVARPREEFHGSS